MRNGIGKFPSVVGRVEEEGLKTVERFDGHGYGGVFQNGSERAETVDYTAPLILRAAAAGQVADWRTKRSHEHLCAEIGRGADALPEKIDGGGVRVGVGEARPAG